MCLCLSVCVSVGLCVQHYTLAYFTLECLCVLFRCGSYGYIVVRSDGVITSSNFYRGADAMRQFFMDLEREEEAIREDLSQPLQY